MKFYHSHCDHIGSFAAHATQLKLASTRQADIVVGMPDGFFLAFVAKI
jgi:hypothetical protein